MFLSRKGAIAFSGLLLVLSCTEVQVKRELSLKEQVAADSERARILSEQFEQEMKFTSLPRAERFLTKTAVKLAQSYREFQLQSIQVRIHLDTSAEVRRGYSFPGTLISVPLGFLKKVEFENELAAFMALELAHVMNRHLASHVEASAESGKGLSMHFFGDGNAFDFTENERSKSIKLGIQLMYFAGYDARGMASIFQRYPQYFGNPLSENGKKEVDFNLRESQRAKSDLLPSLNPIVRSAEFIQFKKELGRLQ